MTIKGLPKLKLQFKALSQIDHSNALLAGADELKNAAQPNSPVDTGLMKSKHATRITKPNEAAFEVNTDYAIYVEYDTPWLRPAIDMSQTRIARAVEPIIDQNNRKVV